MPLLTEAERLYIERIAAISKKDKSTVIDVLRACLMIGVIELLCDNNKISIPYVCDLEINFQDKDTKLGRITDVQLTATPNRGLIDEVIAISEGGESPTELYFKKHILNKFEKLLDVQNEDV